MSTRPILIVAILAVFATFLSGCGGPTKKGIEARNKARARLLPGFLTRRILCTSRAIVARLTGTR